MSYVPCQESLEAWVLLLTVPEHHVASPRNAQPISQQCITQLNTPCNTAFAFMFSSTVARSNADTASSRATTGTLCPPLLLPVGSMPGLMAPPGACEVVSAVFGAPDGVRADLPPAATPLQHERNHRWQKQANSTNTCTCLLLHETGSIAAMLNFVLDMR